jgi:hypothetical protein
MPVQIAPEPQIPHIVLQASSHKIHISGRRSPQLYRYSAFCLVLNAQSSNDLVSIANMVRIPRHQLSRPGFSG